MKKYKIVQLPPPFLLPPAVQTPPPPYQENEEHENGKDVVININHEDNISNGSCRNLSNNNNNNNNVEKTIIIPIIGVVIDCSAMGFADMSALSILIGVIQEYNDIGVKFHLACCQDHVIERLEKTEHYPKLQKLIFPTVADAVTQILQDFKPTAIEPSTKL